jgi:hypothetical protein
MNFNIELIVFNMFLIKMSSKSLLISIIITSMIIIELNFKNLKNQETILGNQITKF